MLALPVDQVLGDILRSFETSRNLVLEAPPGAGKTTRVPPALLESGGAEVLVLEPRRLAARLAARRVAQELGERLGETVGYQVRFDEVSGPRTRLRFLTEGVLTRRLLRDPRLERVGAVVLDEFHERHLEGDLALALLLHLQRTRRSDLRLLVMSATLDAAPIAAHLGACPVLRSEGQLYPNEIRYTPASAAALEQQVADAIDGLARAGLAGDILVFLPGAREIRQAMEACTATLARNRLTGLPLSGDLSPEEQDRAVTSQPGQRKVIFSTNIAESSVTIDGVRHVIDSGLARVPFDSPWTGLPALEVRRISQASATQRAGRAARTGPGSVVRLYPQEDLVRRPARDVPEILRRELSSLVAFLAAFESTGLPWLDPPPPAALEAAQRLLQRLGCHGAQARRMADMPLHPRLARLALEAARLGGGREGAEFAAELSLGVAEPNGESRRLARSITIPKAETHDGHALEKATLAAFPDRVARRLRDREFLLAGGGSALVQRDHVPAWIVAVDIEHRRERGLPLIRTWTAIEPDWLIDYFPDDIEEVRQIVWNRDAERADEIDSVRYLGLTLTETRSRPANAAGLVAEKAFVELHRFADAEKLAALRQRAAFAGRPVSDDDVRNQLAALATGCAGFAELNAAAADDALLRLLEMNLGPSLDRLAPEFIALPSGRRARIHYEADQPPWIESRLQDFFGLDDSPRIGQAQTPVVCRLLAPNQRPVQITQDLAGFWKRHYPEIRRELSRRYPRHAWPEDPYRKN